MLRPYRLLAAVPHAPVLMLTSLLGRLNLPAIPLAMTFLIVDWTGAYVIAGLVGAALTVGQGIAGPLRGRAADRSSAPKLLLITGGCHGLGLCLVGLAATVLDASLWWLVLLIGLLTGLVTPPVSQIARAMWPRIAGPTERDAAYAVDATLQETLFVFAPTAAAMTVALSGPLAATLGLAGWAVIGPSLFAVTLWRAGLTRAPMGDGKSAASHTLLRTPGFIRLLAFGALAIAGLIGTDLILVGWARDRGSPALAGVLAAVWAIGSLIGGLVVGGSARPPVLWRRAAVTAAGLLLLVPVLPPIADPASPWVVSIVLLFGGVAIAPTLAATNGKLAELAPHNRRAEAFGWFTTATVVGAAITSPIVGGVLDAGGPAAGAMMTAIAAVLAAILVAHHSLAPRATPQVGSKMGARD